MTRFAVFDIDGTIFRSSLYIEIVYELARRNVIALPKTAFDEAYQTWANRKQGGYSAYRNKAVEILESQITGMNVSEFDSAAEEVVRAQANHVYVFTRKLVKQLKSEDYFLIALSGSQTQLVKRFAQHWGFNDFIGQTYHEENGKFTGKMTKTHDEKVKIIEPILKKHNLNWEESVAVGDTEGDVSLLERAKRPIAFNPNRTLYRKAVENSWEIIVERKDMIYKLMPGEQTNYELVDTE